MLYSPDIKRAMLFAFNIHKKQFDKAGYPYIHHVLHVAEQMETEEQVIVALLHDVLEDSRDKQTQLLFNQLGLSDRVKEAVYAITKSPNESYDAYINRVSKNRLATTVKLKDLEHNMRSDRLGPSYDAGRLMEKYIMAYHALSTKGGNL